MASKSKRRRRVLGASCILAALIVGASSFAWFTSKDEVTNRLTASSEYGVAIAENFQPPENWVPGQEINKDVGAVNTGNVDAFVRTWLTGSMRVLKQTTSQTKSNITQFSGLTDTNLTDVTDSNLKSMGLTKYGTDDYTYYKTLSKTQTQNAGVSGGNDMYGFGGAMSGPYSEVQAMQGGRLASAPANARFAYTLKEETTLPIFVSKNSATAGYENVTVPAGTVVMVNAETPVEATLSATGVFTPAAKVSYTSASGKVYADTDLSNKGTVYVQTLPILTNVDYESFSPFTDGLYLFLRNEADANLAVTDLEYSGYWVKGTTSNDASTGTYYALNTNTDGTNRSDYTVKSVASDGTTTVSAPVKTTIVNGVITAVNPDLGSLEIYTAKYDDIDNDKLIWRYDSTAGSEKIYAIYDDEKNTAFNKDKDIVVQIDLANIGTDAQNWTAKGGSTTAAYTGVSGIASTLYDGSKVTFYYNDDVEAGDTSAKLVDKVTLHKDVTNKAYLAFDFDLNVNLESIQVTMDENGNEQATAVAAWAATGTAPVNTGANGVQTPSTANGEITKMTWNDIT